MANGMSLSLEPQDILAELGPWLNQTVEDQQERAFWEQILGLSRIGWYVLRATKFVGVTDTCPTGIVGTTETGAVFVNDAQQVLVQAWRGVTLDNASTGIRVIGIDGPGNTVDRLGHLVVRDGPREPDRDIPIHNGITHRPDRVEGFLSLVAGGVDHTKIIGHADMTQREIHRLAAWIMSVIAAAGAIPDADITSKYGPISTNQP